MKNHEEAYRLQTATFTDQNRDSCEFYKRKDRMICVKSTNNGSARIWFFVTHFLFLFLLTASLCTGDSGGPLVIEVAQRNYVRGIVSLGKNKPSDGGAKMCDPDHPYSILTNVQQHSKWIDDIVSGNSD
jgi:secreted trypsin-like serine protease